MKRTFVVTCSNGYLFGLNATMNAAKFFGTNAEFTVITDDIPEDTRNKYIDAFPFKVNWVFLSELLTDLKVTAKYYPCRFWVAPWVLGEQLVDSYDSVCILQADEFLMTNVNNLFDISSSTDIVIATEYTGSCVKFEDLPFGTTKSIWNRFQYALYDQLVFFNKTHKQILIDICEQQCVDPWKDEGQQPMCALNQACATHLNRDRVMGLDGHLWAWDRNTCDSYLSFEEKTKKFYNENNIELKGIHNRWWQPGLAPNYLSVQRSYQHEEGKKQYATGMHNSNLVRDVMVQFNEMTPATKNTNYYSDIIK